MMEISLTPYACMYGHVIYSEDDVSRMLCPKCLGKVKNPTLDDPRLLSHVQDTTELIGLLRPPQ